MSTQTASLPMIVRNIDSTSTLSKREYFRVFYEEINQVAKPGDIVFFISQKKNETYGRLTTLYRRWQGIDDHDLRIWHTAILVEPKKESNGSHWLPRIIHAICKGVEEIYIPRSYFTSVREGPTGEVIQKGRIEIIQNRELSDLQRQNIVNYAKTQLGRPFADLGWRHDFLTYSLGLSPKKLDPGKVSCHGMAYFAYEKIGFSFPHQLGNTPFFNPARYIGHPRGQSATQVDLRRLYLRDHHLYRDPRFESILAIFEKGETKQIQAIRYPGKC